MRVLTQLGKDAERLWPAMVAVALAILFGVLLIAVGRGVNRPPVITGMEVQPAKVARGGTAVVRVTARDPDGDPLTYTYAAESGRLVAAALRPDEAQYSTAEQGSIADRVTVTITDARGLGSSSSTVITIEDAPVVTPAPPADDASVDDPFDDPVDDTSVDDTSMNDEPPPQDFSREE